MKGENKGKSKKILWEKKGEMINLR
jgi:hypothetical protein